MSIHRLVITRTLSVASSLSMLGTTTASAAEPRASLTGDGRGVFAAGPFVGDHLQLAIAARTHQDGSADGRFALVQHSSGGGLEADFHGAIDCLAITHGDATVTGVITQGTEAFGVDPIGARVSFTIAEGRPQTLEIDISFASGHAIAPCSSNPIFSVPLLQGSRDSPLQQQPDILRSAVARAQHGPFVTPQLKTGKGDSADNRKLPIHLGDKE